MALQKQQLLLPHEVRSFEEPAEENGTPWSGSATGAECAPTVCTYVHVDVFVSTTNVIGVSTMPRQRARSSMASSASSKRCWKGRLVHLLYHRRCRTKPQFRHEAFVCHSEGNGDAERHPLRGQIWVASNLGCKCSGSRMAQRRGLGGTLGLFGFGLGGTLGLFSLGGTLGLFGLRAGTLGGGEDAQASGQSE